MPHIPATLIYSIVTVIFSFILVNFYSFIHEKRKIKTKLKNNESYTLFWLNKIIKSIVKQIDNINEFNNNGSLFFSGNGTSRNISSFKVDAETGAFSDRIVQPANTMGDAGTLTGMGYVNFSTAAQQVSVAGRVIDDNGVGIQRAQVSFTDELGVTRNTTTNTFGHYKFDGLLTGEHYTIDVRQRRTIVLTQPLNLENELLDLDLTIPSN